MTTKLGRLVEFTLLADPHEEAEPQKGCVRSSSVIMVAPGTVQCTKKVGNDAAVVPLTGVSQINVPVVYLTLFNGLNVVVTESYAQVVQMLRDADGELLPQQPGAVECPNCGQIGLHAPGCVFTPLNRATRS